MEKFFLGDVLAMTGYTPHSAFGGTFDEKSVLSFSSVLYCSFSQSGNDFPSIEHFHEPSSYGDQSLHTTQTVPNLQQYQQQHYSQPPTWQPPQYAAPYPPANMLPYAPNQQPMPMEQMGGYTPIQRSTTVPADLQGMQNGYQMPSNQWGPNGMPMMPPPPYAENQMYGQQSQYIGNSYQVSSLFSLLSTYLFYSSTAMETDGRNPRTTRSRTSRRAVRPPPPRPNDRRRPPNRRGGRPNDLNVFSAPLGLSFFQYFHSFCCV